MDVTKLIQHLNLSLEFPCTLSALWIQALDGNYCFTIIQETFVYIAKTTYPDNESVMEVASCSFDLI